MRFEKMSRKHNSPNKGQLERQTQLKVINLALHMLQQTHNGSSLAYDLAAAKSQVTAVYHKAHKLRSHSGSPWGKKCKLGGRGGLRKFGFGRHKLKLFGERGRLPLIYRASW